jgi:hypothetical protein
MKTLQRFIKEYRWPLLTVAVVAIAATVVATIYHRQQRTVSQYKDQSGIVYECSRELKADKYDDYGFAAGSQYRPADMNEAAKYCQAVGIE